MQQDRKGPARERQPSSGSESRAADMEAAMQEKALRHASELLQSVPTGNRPNPTQLACAIKKEFDEVYGPAWHCIVGKSFGSFITHTEGGFIYFSIGSLSFLLFRTEVRPVVVPDSTFPTAKAKPR